ncbi:MAG: DEAD/DEAH box helicase, partial [Saprospiraceae bacterium]
MHVFTLQNNIIRQYRSFLDSFIRIKHPAIREKVETDLQAGKLLPEPLLQFNPAYQEAGSVDALCQEGILESRLADTFSGYTLYQHQLEAIMLGASGQNFVVTSGTGSGKSLTYIASIFNHILRNPNPTPSVRAIIVYPMNALINSQEQELERYAKNFEDQRNQPFPLTCKKYTGQESEDEKRAIKANPPDILLTNYMMLELIMTRSGEANLRENMQENLEFLAFDELHTYRGRQGSDIALLIRRIKAKAQKELRFMGTSATLVSGDNLQEQKEEVAALATQIFGKPFQPEQVINESLKVQTVFSEPLPDAAVLRQALNTPIDPGNPEENLRVHPLAVWLENRVVLERRGDWIRRGKPLSLNAIAGMLTDDSGEPVETCERQVLALLQWSETLSALKKSRSIFPFKLHQFISQTGSVYMSLDPPEKRVITLEPGYYINTGGDSRKPIFPVVFSRISGHDFICVRKNQEESCLEPRNFHDSLIEESDANNLEAGYLIIPHGDEEIWNDSEVENLPDAWIQYSQTRQAWEAKPNYRNRLPRKIYFDGSGRFSETEPLESWGWYMPTKLLFDLTCGTFYDPKTKEGTKLMTLGNEGRSSATTILSFAIVHELHRAGIPDEDQKVLSFTDNRQDAALQAGHFNDLLQVVRVRSAIFHALQQTQGAALDYTTIADSVFSTLNLPQEAYAQKPANTPGARRDNENALKDYLMTRILLDLKRGWRVTVPNLEQCGLLKISYKYLDEDAANTEFWSDLDGVNSMAPDARLTFLENLLDFFRTAYALNYHKLSNPRQLQ